MYYTQSLICTLYTGAVAVSSAHFGQGRGPIWLDNVNCMGGETTLAACRHAGYGIQNCAHNKDAGVRCHEGTARSIMLKKKHVVNIERVTQRRECNVQFSEECFKHYKFS